MLGWGNEDICRRFALSHLPPMFRAIHASYRPKTPPKTRDKEANDMDVTSSQTAEGRKVMGTYNVSSDEIADRIHDVLDEIEGDFTKKTLLEALEKSKKYPWVSDRRRVASKQSGGES